MSVFRWRYDETCEGRYCCGDCDKCDKEDDLELALEAVRKATLEAEEKLKEWAVNAREGILTAWEEATHG